MKSKKILIVEDERLVAEDISECLTSRGFEVCGICKSGAEAIEAAREHLPELVMMDIVLQGEMDGIDTAGVLKEELDIPAIFLTAYSQERILDRAKKVDPLGYVVKPFDEGNLISTVEIGLHKSRIDRELRKSKEWFSTTLNSIGDGVIATDENARVKFLNKIAEELTGWSSDEADGVEIEEVFNIVNETTRLKVINPAIEALETNQIRALANHTILIRKDGSEFHIDDSGAPIHGSDGTCVGAVLVFRDVSERKKAQEEVRRHQQQLEELVEERTRALAERVEMERLVIEISSDLIRLNEETFERGLYDALERIGSMMHLDGCGIKSADGSRKFHSESAWASDEKMLDLISKSQDGAEGSFPFWAEQMQSDGRIAICSREEVPAVAIPERQFMEALEIESLVVLPLGHVSPVQMAISFSSREPRIWSEDDFVMFEMFSGVLKNVLERRSMEASQRELQEQLTQSQKMEAIGKLTGGIAHDFNNMLVPIIGYADMIIGSSDTGGYREEAEEIRRAAESAAALTGQLLAFSRKQILHKLKVDMNRLIPNMGGMLKSILGEDIRTQVEIDENLAPVWADRSQLEQVILNLCVNSRDAMPQGGCLVIRAWNGKDELGLNTVMISIQDDGAGMSREVIENIFDPFFTTKGMEGTGLGLSVVLGVVEQHDGMVTVDSEEGSGTQFTITLPACPFEAKAVPENGEGDCGIRKTHGNGERILLVEDEPSVALFVSRALTAHGYEVTVATDKSSAIQIFDLEKGQFDMILTDAKLPDGNGIQVVEHVFAHSPRMRVLLSSGYTDDRAQVDQARNRGVEFLQKPYPLETLYETVSDVLRNEPSCPLDSEDGLALKVE